MSAAAYFDSRVDLMATNREAGTGAICYDQQAALVESLIEPGMAILDVGCGPSLPYVPPARTFVIGLDPSSETLAANRDLNAHFVGTAESIPLPSGTTDLVIAFYSLHHMTGRSRRETYLMRCRALEEMYRVVRPGGELLIFEVCPQPWAKSLQSALWERARRLLGRHLDAYFWSTEEIATAGRQAGLDLTEIRTFDCPAWATFPPILSLPWLRIPRWLYPFTPTLIRWRKP